MTEDQQKFALHLINNPPPGSELAKAREYGVDLTLFISTLRRSPTERARCLSEGARIFQIAKQPNLREKGSPKKRSAFFMTRAWSSWSSTARRWRCRVPLISPKTST